MHRSDVLNNQRCFIMSFGYHGALPFPYLRMTITTHLNVGTFGNNSPNICSIVVIGGKYLEQVDEVMRMVDKIPWMPSAVFLMAEKPGQDIKFNMSTTL